MLLENKRGKTEIEKFLFLNVSFLVFLAANFQILLGACALVGGLKHVFAKETASFVQIWDPNISQQNNGLI